MDSSCPLIFFFLETGCLPFTKTVRLEISGINYIKYDVAGEGIAIKYIYISYRDLKEQKNSITSNHSANHSIFQLEFPVFPCKCSAYASVIIDLHLVFFFLSVLFLNFTFGFHAFYLKMIRL